MKKFLNFIFILSIFGLTFFIHTENCSAQQQGFSSEGRDFYIGFVNPSYNNDTPDLNEGDSRGFFGMFALISSSTNNTAFISYFDPIKGVETAPTGYSIFSRQGIIVPLSRPKMQMADSLGDNAEFRSCHITSKYPINVQYLSEGANAGSSYLALPNTALGKKYVIASYNDNPGVGAISNKTAENAGGFFQIIAPVDSTKVTIIPNGLTAGSHKGVNSGSGATGVPHPYNITLQRGQCYLVRGDGSNPNNDMSGSIVTSDKPIVVLAGHEDAFLGSISGTTESRNFMIQEMVPSEYSESGGYVSIPLKDSNPISSSDSGYGENFRVFAFDTNTVNVKETDEVTNSISTAAYQYPAKEIHNIGSPAEFHSTNGGKFSVMMYDLRSQSTNPPFPAPSMMTIVPMSHWKTSFLAYIPADNYFQIDQNYYINVIALGTDIDKGFIKFSHNGDTLKSITKLVSDASYTNIPNHSELKGVRYIVNPGSYYFTNTRNAYINPLSNNGTFTAPSDQIAADTSLLHGSFIVYHYDMRALDPDFDLGDIDADDFFFENATPSGMRLGNGKGNPKIKVDTLCTSWHICVHDSIPIRSIQLLDDPNGDLIRPGKVYHNVSFDASSDPNNLHEIDYQGNDTSVCFDVLISNPFDTAYAPLYIIDAAGTHIEPIPEFHYYPPQVQVSKLPDLPKQIDTLIYPNTRIGDQICSTLVYINASKKTGRSFNVSAVSILHGNRGFAVNSIVPLLPIKLFDGDTLKLNICFSPQDTGLIQDSIILRTDCFNAPLPITGSGGTALIKASDYDFGDVLVGTTKCHDLLIQNVGNLPFILTKNWLLHNSIEFSIDSANAVILPDTIKPGSSIRLTFCYTPQSLDGSDSTTIDWNTDIPEPYTNQVKSWSYLKGNPTKPGLTWDRSIQYFVADSLVTPDSVIYRVILSNQGNATATQLNVFVIGATSSEFSIVGNQLGYKPLSGFDVSVGQSIWVDISFKPDLTKPYPDRFMDRIDSLVATSFDDATNSLDSTFIKLIGTWTKSGVSESQSQQLFTIRPNPASGNSVIVTLKSPSLQNANISLYDILGREVYGNKLTQGIGEVEAPILNLIPGLYYIKLSSQNTVETQKIEIVR